MRKIRAEADRQGLLEDSAGVGSGESFADLLAEDRWRRGWSAEQQRRTQADRQSVERHKAHKALEDEERRARQAALRDRPRPVRSWTLQRLGVHAAIAGHRADPGGSGFVVPTYVSRPHDGQLRARLAAAVADEASLLVVVRGESCTGKTRTAAEALKAAVPDDFDLLFPANADDLLAALAADALGPRCVLWLNEAQDYLDGPAGEAVAAALLRRLDTEGPFLVIATLWPDHDKALTEVTASGGDDQHRQARALLAQAQYTYLPGSFADALDAVRRAADHDASLAAALKAAGADLTQTLAAGPDLVAHYEQPAGPHGVYGKALVSGAMDAHRLGVTAPLPLDFLRDAAPGYLTDAQRAAADPDTWFTGALIHAQTLIRQIVSPLQDVPRPTGMGPLTDMVRLADYLQQHGRRTRRRACPPASFWDAAAKHLTDPDSLCCLAQASQVRHRYRHAAQLYCAAGETGDPEALTQLSMMQGEARHWKVAERVARAAAENGGIYALPRLAAAREDAGDREEAERLWRAGAESGHGDAWTRLAEMRAEAGDRKAAERFYRVAAKNGAFFALQPLARMREKAGDREAAERFYWAAARRGEPVLGTLAQMCEEEGEQEAAEQLARVAADNMQPYVLAKLAQLREEAGDREGVERLHQAAVDIGNCDALRQLAQLREKAGDQEAAEWLYWAAADNGDTYALTHLAQLRKEAGDREEAERLYQAAADNGNANALLQLVQLREEAGDREQAERLAHAAVDNGQSVALALLVHMREMAGDREAAEELAHACVDSGDSFSLSHLAQMREKAGDREEAERLYQAAVDSGTIDALADLARLREEAGDREEAERLYQAAVDSGTRDALAHLIEVRQGSAEEYQRYGLEADGTLAEPWVWPEPHTLAGDTP